MEVVFFLLGLILCGILAMAAMYYFGNDNPPIGFLCAVGAVVALIGGILLANQVFANDCEAAGGYMLGDSCYGFSDPEFEIDDD